MMGSSWFDAALLGTTNALLWEATMVMLLYCRVQNSGNPLQGTVLVGAAAELVELAVLFVAVLLLVAVAAMPPPICVRLT